jgi:hypothetical protein
MLKLPIAVLSILFFGLVSCSQKADAGADPVAPAPPQPGFAVVELFTSQGCSSCPPADKLLSQIVTGARAHGQAVFPLAFHVDYWNHLGWADPFSSASFSARQQSYASALNLQQIYTPQMIVNGSTEFVGSDSNKADQAIQTALGSASTLTLKLQSDLTSGTLHIHYDLTGTPPHSTLNLAVVERGLVTNVKAGENAGETLTHDNVVRVFQSASLTDATGTAKLTIPEGVNLKNASLIGFIQEKDSMKILAAAQTDLSN